MLKLRLLGLDPTHKLLGLDDPVGCVFGLDAIGGVCCAMLLRSQVVHIQQQPERAASVARHRYMVPLSAAAIKERKDCHERMQDKGSGIRKTNEQS